MSESVERGGGRWKEKAEAHAKADGQRLTQRAAQHQLDTRQLIVRPEFRRWLAYWLDKADVLTVPEPTLPHDALRAQLGKQYLAMEMLSDVQALDLSFVMELWGTTQAETSTNA
jgi:hypothetical protein